MGMPIGPGSMDFYPSSLPFLALSSLSCHTGVEGAGRRGRDQCWCWCSGGDWMTYGEEEGTVFFRLHLLQNGVSSLSSIPHLISPNNLPFSSCPNRESQNLRECECVGERERGFTRSHTNSLFLCVLAGDRVIKPGEKQRAVCRSEEVVALSREQRVLRKPKSQKEGSGVEKQQRVTKHINQVQISSTCTLAEYFHFIKFYFT